MKRDERAHPPVSGSGGVDPGWVTRVEAVRRSAMSRWLFYGILSVLVLLDFFVPKEHAVFAWEILPGFNAVYGLISCIVIILVSKWLGHAGLMKRESYYD